MAHANTTLAVGSTHVDNCTCLAGYMLEGTETCAECQQGSYKSSPGDHACRLCGEDIPPHAEHDTDEQRQRGRERCRVVERVWWSEAALVCGFASAAGARHGRQSVQLSRLWGS